MIKGLMLLAVLGLVLTACGKEETKHAHAPSEYGEVIKECELTSKLIEGYISQNNSDLVQAAAKAIKRAAGKLSRVARKEIPKKMVKDVKAKTKKLRRMCTKILKAAQAGKKDEAIQVNKKIKDLIAELNKYTEHAKASHKGDN